MPETGYYLAEVNIARMRAPLDDPLMAPFVALLAPINAEAEASPGYVWRLQTEDGDATALRVFDDARILINMSVWESVEALHAYTYKSAHIGLIRGRREWFEPVEGPRMALWWIPRGTLPTVQDARARLDLLARSGPTPDAFTFTHLFPPPEDDAPRTSSFEACDWYA
jgi:hypothetical protein